MNRARALTMIAIVSLLLAAAAYGKEQTIQLVACRGGSCATTLDDISDSEFVWIWSENSPPKRLLLEAAKAVVASGGDLPGGDSLVVTIAKPRKSGPPRLLRVLAAPEKMWTEVPEPMLPRYTVADDRPLTIPYARDVAWLARLTGDGQGSWWTRVAARSRNVTIVAVPAVTRRIKITGASGERLASAAVSIAVPKSASARGVAAQLRPDAHGVVTLESLPDRDPLTLIVSEPDHAPFSLEERVRQLPQTIELHRGVRVRGRFLNVGEEPVSGVLVRAEGWLEQGGVVVARKGESKSDGTWEISQLPQNTKLTMAAEKRGFVPLRKEISLEGKSVDLGPMTLDKGQTIVVRAVDDLDNRPIAGVRFDAKFDRKAISDSKGIATLRDVSMSSPIEVTTEAVRYLPATTELMPPFGKEVEIALTRAFTVKGRFVDRTGAAIPDVTARVVSGSSFRDITLNGGVFSIALQPDQQMVLELTSPSTRIIRFDLEGSRGEIRDLGAIHPDEGGAILGRVTTPDGRPIGAASIWTPRPATGGVLISWATGDLLRAESDQEGRFAIRGVGAEPVLLRIDASGFARAFRSVLFDEFATEVDLGDIVLSEGSTVKVLGRSDNFIARLALRRDSADIDTLSSTMRDGIATIEHVPAGSAIVTLSQGRSTVCEKEIDVPAESRVVEVDCSADNVRVRGTVTVGGRPAGGGTLVWSSPHSIPVAGVIMNRVSSLGARQQQVHGGASEVTLWVTSDGKFETDELRAGAWKVRWIALGGESSEPREVFVPEQPETTMIIDYPAGRIFGSVVDDKFRTASRAVVRELGGRGFAFSREDGAFAMAGLAAAKYRLQAELGESRSDIAEVDVHPGGKDEPVQLVLRKRPADQVMLQVFTAEGMPAGNAFVFIETTDGETRILTTDLEGRARLTFRGAPPSALRCAAMHNGGWIFGEWQQTSAWRDGVTLRAGRTGTLSISGVARGEMLRISAPSGWNISSLMLRIGAVPALLPPGTFHVPGLPPGVYDSQVGPRRMQATVRAGETTKVTLD